MAIEIADKLSEYEKDATKVFDDTGDFLAMKHEISKLLNDLESSINNQDHIS